MPIANKINRTLAGLYDTSETNIYDDYGDDFEADSDKEPSLNGETEGKATRKKESQYFDRESTNNTERSALFKKRKDQTFGSTVGGYRDSNRRTYSESLTPRQKESGRGTGKGRSILGSRMKKGGFHSSPKQRGDGVVVKRVLSANRNKVNALQNLILELQNENEQLRLENRDLKRSSRIQEKVIKKYDNEEAEVPLLIQKHNSEVRFLKDKLKRQKEGIERSRDEINRKDLEVQKLRDRVRRYEELIKERQLDEREKLQQKLTKLENDLNEKELKISELERVIKFSERARVRETKEKNEKYKKAIDELKKLEHNQRDLEYRFKEKEKELEIQNIYSQRIALKKKMPKSQSNQGSYSANGLTSSRLSKPPSPLIMDISEVSRERTDDYIESSLRGREVNSTGVTEASQVETMVSALKKKEEELEKLLEEERSRRRFEDDQRKLKEMEEKIRRKEEEILRAEKEREEKRKEEDRIKKEEENAKMRLAAERESEERKFLETIGQEKEKNLQAIKRLEIEAKKEVEQGEVSRAEVKKTTLEDSEKPVEFGFETSSNVTGPAKPAVKNKTKPIFLESNRKDDQHVKHPPLDFRYNDGKKPPSKEHNSKRADDSSPLSSHRNGSGRTSNSKGNDELLFGEYNPTVNSAGRKRASKFRGQDKRDEEKEDFLFFDTKNDNKSKILDNPKDSKTNQDTFLTSRSRTKSPVNNDTSVILSNKNKTKPDQDATGTSFGAYQPTFGNENVESKNDPFSPEDDPFSEDRPKYGRRGYVPKPTSDKGFFETGLDNTRTGISNLFNGAEKKADNLGTSAMKTISNFGDDDIEEVVLT